MHSWPPCCATRMPGGATNQVYGQSRKGAGGGKQIDIENAEPRPWRVAIELAYGGDRDADAKVRPAQGLLAQGTCSSRAAHPICIDSVIPYDLQHQQIGQPKCHCGEMLLDRRRQSRYEVRIAALVHVRQFVPYIGQRHAQATTLLSVAVQAPILVTPQPIVLLQEFCASGANQIKTKPSAFAKAILWMGIGSRSPQQPANIATLSIPTCPPCGSDTSLESPPSHPV